MSPALIAARAAASRSRLRRRYSDARHAFEHVAAGRVALDVSPQARHVNVCRTIGIGTPMRDVTATGAADGEKRSASEAREVEVRLCSTRDQNSEAERTAARGGAAGDPLTGSEGREGQGVPAAHDTPEKYRRAGLKGERDDGMAE